MFFSEFKVLVRCYTFNHSNYVSDTLNGFVMQKTDFPYVCCIVDDASTDGEQRLLDNYLRENFLYREAQIEETSYANIVFAQHAKNANCFFAIILLKENHYSKKKSKLPYFTEWIEKSTYVSLCEGDDYWISPNKLQRQIDWLDAHPDYTMCCSDAKVLWGERELEWGRYPQDSDILLTEMIEGGGFYVQTATVTYRKEIRGYLMEPFIRNCNTGDYSLQIMCAYKGKVRYFEEKTAVYRFRTPGSWSSRDLNSGIEILLKNWRSVVNMLDGFDSYMDYKCSESIKKRKIKYISEKYFRYTKNRRAIIKEFSDVFSLMSLSEKIELWYSGSKLRIPIDIFVYKFRSLVNLIR